MSNRSLRLISLLQHDVACDELCCVDVSPSDVRAIIFPEPGQLRSRRVVSRSNSHSAGKYPSWKMKRMLHWESVNELNAFRLLDCDPEVRRFGEQPCKIEYVMDGVERVHYPDILVITTKSKEFWEVKPQSKPLESGVLQRTALLSRVLPWWGYAYRMVLAEDLGRQPRLNNASVILRFGRNMVSDRDWESIRRIADQRGQLIWSAACCGDYGAKGREILCGLVLKGFLTIDMNSQLSPETQFFATRGL